MTSPLLRPDEWLPSQSPAFQEAVRAIRRRRFLEAGTPLYRTDEWGGIYGVHSGCLEITVQFDCSRLRGLHFAYPGYFLGNRPAKVNVPYVVSVTARQDSEVDVLPFAKVSQLVDAQPQWWRSFSSITDHWFDVATCGGLDLMLRQPEARLIAVLLRLGGYRPFLKISVIPRLVPISPAELAENANVRLEDTEEILSSLAAQALIAMIDGGILVARSEELQALLETISD